MTRFRLASISEYVPVKSQRRYPIRNFSLVRNGYYDTADSTASLLSGVHRSVAMHR